MQTSPAKSRKAAKPPPPRMSLSETLAELEKAGSEQTRKTYRRHGASEPLFGVQFSTLKTLMKRIGVDQELALALWDTGNFDARNLAVKIVDPGRMSPTDLDRWAGQFSTAMSCGAYVAMVAAEGPHGNNKVKQWLASDNLSERLTGWTLVGQLASRDESIPDAWFLERLSTIEETLHAAPNAERERMNGAVITIGGRNAALRDAAVAAARRIGPVDVDHGDTACKTPDAVASLAKSWARAEERGFASPAAQERNMDSPRLRC